MFQILKNCLILCLLCQFVSAYSQNEEEWLKESEKALKFLDYYTWADYADIAYEACTEFYSPDCYKYAYIAAERYMFIRNYEKAAKLFREVLDKTEEYPKVEYYYARMLQMTGRYYQAMPHFRKFKNSYRGRDGFDYKELSQNLIKGSQLALNDTNEKEFDVIHLGEEINAAYTDMAPFLIDRDRLLFGSVRRNDLLILEKGESEGQKAKASLYISEDDKGWTQANLADYEFNDTKKDITNAFLDANSGFMFFTYCDKDKDYGNVRCEIYMAKSFGPGTEKAAKLPESINDPESSNTQPAAFSKEDDDEIHLYFASDREDSRGGMDLWYSVYNIRKDDWSKPRNLGRDVNTAFDETTPYYDGSEQKLYFSSEGLESIGGLDVFSINGSESRFSGTPQNLGTSINSPADDLYYRYFPQYKKGFLVSNREGGIALKHETCCDDIYQIEPIDKSKNIQLVTTNDETDDGLENIKGTLSYNFKGNEQKLEAFSDSSGSMNWKIPDNARDVNLVLEDPGYFRKTLAITLPENDSLSLRAGMVRKTEKPIVIPNIYYDFDKATLRLESKTAIDTSILKLMTDNPQIIVEIGSHTDSKGSVMYNKTLSQERAQSVVNYLITNGISKNRLKAKGYGEAKPIAPNTNPDGSDNPEGRQKNRRTEFRLISELEDGSKAEDKIKRTKQ